MMPNSNQGSQTTADSAALAQQFVDKLGEIVALVTELDTYLAGLGLQPGLAPGIEINARNSYRLTGEDAKQILAGLNKPGRHGRFSLDAATIIRELIKAESLPMRPVGRTGYWMREHRAAYPVGINRFEEETRYITIFGNSNGEIIGLSPGKMNGRKENE